MGKAWCGYLSNGEIPCYPYEIEPMCRFAGLCIIEAIFDDTTILTFRHLLEEQKNQERDVKWLIACRPGKLKALSKKNDKRMIEKVTAQLRAKTT